PCVCAAAAAELPRLQSFPTRRSSDLVDGRAEAPRVMMGLYGFCSPKSISASTSRASSYELLRLLTHTSICVMLISVDIIGAKASARLKLSRKYCDRK